MCLGGWKQSWVEVIPSALKKPQAQTPNNNPKIFCD